MPKVSRLKAWGQLLRLPNLFTVPGDPLAGYLLATGGILHWRVAGAMAASLLLYSAGLLLNDYFDRNVDAKERPDRPIPSGAVKAGTVLAIGLVLLVAGVAVAFAVGGTVAGLVACTVALAVFSYDAGLKRVRLLGPMVMGCCRGGSVLIGTAMVLAETEAWWFPADSEWWRIAVLAAEFSWGYTTIITLLSTGEASAKPLGLSAFFPAFTLLLAGGFMLPVMSAGWPVNGYALAALAFAVAASLGLALGMCRGRMPVPAFIGKIIRAMIPVQAAWCLWCFWHFWPYDEALACGLLAGFAALWLLASLAARRFHGS